VTDNSCWTCAFQKLGGNDTFLGKCRFPARNNPDRDKKIPPEVVDNGCRHHVMNEKGGAAE